MTTDVTLGDLLTTDLGKQMAAEVEAARQTKAAEVEDGRQAELAEWRAKLAEVAPGYESLRAEILPALAGLAERVDRLAVMRAQLKALRSFIVKAGAEPDGYPLPLGPGEVRRATDTLRAILSRLGYDL